MNMFDRAFYAYCSNNLIKLLKWTCRIYGIFEIYSRFSWKAVIGIEIEDLLIFWKPFYLSFNNNGKNFFGSFDGHSAEKYCIGAKKSPNSN